MSRRRVQHTYLTDEEGTMGVMHIPGHERQRPREVALEEIRTLMGNCQLCPLGQTRTTLVFGVGNPHARVVFVGEGPGRNEDLQGEPFVGAAGQNLNALLSLAGLRREDIYICNVIKCRPPGNRNPRPEEIAACSPFLREQIRSIWPDVIVCLGNFAAHFVLRTEAGITSLRGRFHQAGHFAVLPTFHPAAALYHREWQQYLDDDFRLLGQWLAEHPVQSGGPASPPSSQPGPVTTPGGVMVPTEMSDLVGAPVGPQDVAPTQVPPVPGETAAGAAHPGTLPRGAAAAPSRQPAAPLPAPGAVDAARQSPVGAGMQADRSAAAGRRATGGVGFVFGAGTGGAARDGAAGSASASGQGSLL